MEWIMYVAIGQECRMLAEERYNGTRFEDLDARLQDDIRRDAEAAVIDRAERLDWGINMARKITEKARHATMCHICGGIIYVGDVVVISHVGINQVASHPKCDPELSIGGQASPGKGR